MIETEKIVAPCFRCRHSAREMVNPELKITKNGKTMAFGECAHCGTTITRLVKTGTVL